MFIHSPWVGKKFILLLLFILFVFREKWDDCSLAQAQERSTVTYKYAPRATASIVFTIFNYLYSNS